MYAGAPSAIKKTLQINIISILITLMLVSHAGFVKRVAALGTISVPVGARGTNARSMCSNKVIKK